MLREDERIKVLNVTKNKVIVDEKRNYIQQFNTQSNANSPNKHQ